MSSYTRPSINSPRFHDADGHVIEYGNRWGGPPPEDTYSVETHPERFAPLHTIADALIAHLHQTYDVEIDQGVEVAADLLHPSYHDVLRAVRIRPNGPSCASLTLIFTAYPGILIHAGLLNDFHYPVCGCDACDSNWEAEADDLEQHVLAVVTGHYRETVEWRKGDPWVGYMFSQPPPVRAFAGGSRQPGVSPDRLKAAQTILRNGPEEWSEWPSATSSS